MTRARILVVDDERGMLHAVERVLAPTYTVISFSSPVEALAQAAAFAPDIALLDIRMPEMSGFDLVDRLRGCCPDLDVIFMTGSVEEIDSAHVSAILKKAFYFVQKPFDRRVLLTLIERCLELRRLSAENKRYMAELESEMAEARAFQRSLLPPPEARMAGVSIAARCIPSAELGGDLYGYHEGGRDRVALLIADVAGHGASAAMLTGVVKSAFDSSRSDGGDPAFAVGRVAEGLRGFEANKFVTLLCVMIDRKRGSLAWVNAGHPPGLLWGPNRQPLLLGSTGPIISPALPAAAWRTSRVDLTGGERLLLYTDGLIEAERGDEFFGRGRVLAMIERHPDGGAALLDALLASAAEFTGHPAHDDVTLLTASF